MRKPVTLDPDVASLLERTMQERGIGLNQAVNDALRAGLGRGREPFHQRTASMGEPRVDLEKALTLSDEIEDDIID